MSGKTPDPSKCPPGPHRSVRPWRNDGQNVRFSVIEPGVVDTELFGHQRESMLQQHQQLFGGIEKLHPKM